MFYPEYDLDVLLRRRPDALAFVHGSSRHPTILGTVSFYQTERGVIVVADVSGLPFHAAEKCEANAFFAFHIHSGGACTGTEADPFANVMGHYNPDQCPHPDHSGDLPPLLSNQGHAFSAVLTDRFTVKEIIGRTVVIHGSPDDFVTQPSGNAGEKIACGVIRP